MERSKRFDFWMGLILGTIGVCFALNIAAFSVFILVTLWRWL